ncbi:putative sulfate exporter family transporter [Actinopolymorpha sp. B17G11]|uniref:YeiH family protein n=1 Tax=Actinopolymorpha sp. B17G11 TaxID=3160861 RepID=UPI0032E447B2
MDSGERTVRTGPVRVVPGLAVTALAIAVAAAVNRLLPAVSALIIALALGVLLANSPWNRPALHPGTRLASRRLLRAGVVLLGLQLSIVDLARLGGPVLVVVVATVGATFAFTWWAGVRMGVGEGQSLLVAAGFAVCGASAVAAMDRVADNDDEDVAAAVALVTIFGTVCIVALPLLREPLGLAAVAYGQWVGVSVHEVAQVVAAAAPAGPAAGTAALVVKLTRVAMLAPLVAGTSLLLRRRRRTHGATARRHEHVVPLFVIGFLAMAALRSAGVVPTEVLNAARLVSMLLLTAALFGLGTGVKFGNLRAAAPISLALGAVSTTFAAVVGLVGILLVT